jgi:release factor glutamine methyltransferase
MTRPAGAERVWTIGALLRWTEQFLSQKGCELPRLDAEVLLSHALGCRRIELYTRSEEVAADEVRTKFRELVMRRVEGCPVAYLVGTKEFYLLPFAVTPAVLIPRPATEALVLAALDRAKPLATLRVLDIGTGSGCLAVSVAKRHAGASVVAVDTSAEALDVARGNAERHGVTDRVAFRHSDLFTGIMGEPPFDLILSNPPYVPSADIAALASDVRDHEPRAALDGGPDGLAVFTRLITGAPEFLNPGGWLLVEIGAGQEAEALRRVAAVPALTAGLTVRDGDGHPRVVVAKRSEV